MIYKKQKHLEQLKHLYLFIFTVSAVLVIPAHLLPQPYFMPFRLPHYLQMMGPFLGVSWPMSFEIYHYGLYVLVIIGSLNTLGILFYPKLRNTALYSSLIGIFFISSIVLFFFLVFLNVNASTAIIYGIYSVVLLIADLLTFKALIKKEKEASRE